MGVERTEYIVVGVDMYNILEYYKGTEDIDDFCDRYYFQRSKGKMVFVNDFYNGEFLVIGEILQSCDIYDGEELGYNFFGKEKEIEDAKLRVKAFIEEYFDVVNIEPSVIVRTQLS